MAASSASAKSGRPVERFKTFLGRVLRMEGGGGGGGGWPWMSLLRNGKRKASALAVRKTEQ